MKHLALLLFLTLGVALPVRAEVSVSLNFFVDALEPHGSWIDVEDYGYCWRPRVADENPDWRPYTEGHWAYTDGGWTWISDEDWGWATYHYGRWIRIHARWCWVPGYEWAPAWVSWRENDDSLGWAPLPPEARWDARIGFSTWTDGYYDVGPDCYSFVPRRFFGERSLRSHYLDRRRNFASFEHSVNITRIVYRKNVVNNIFVGGPQLERIERDGGGHIERLQLRRDTSGFQREWREDASRGPSGRYRALSRIEGDQLIVAAPRVDRNAKLSPPRRIAERLGKETIDRGWRGLDPEETDRLRGSLRASAERNRPRGLPARPEKPRTAWAVRSSPPSGQPSEEVRKPVPPERRAEDVPRRGASGDDTLQPPREAPRRGVPVPGIRPQPSEKPVRPIPPSPPGLKRDDDLVKPVRPVRPQPKTLPDQPRPTREELAPRPRGLERDDGPVKTVPSVRPQPNTVPDQPKPRREKPAPRPRGREVDDAPQLNVPDRPVVPRRPSPRASDDSAVKTERARPGPPAAAPLPRPQITPSPSSPRVRDPKQGDQVGQKRVQATPRPRPQPQPAAQPKASRPASSPKKAPPSSDEEEKRKNKKH